MQADVLARMSVQAASAQQELGNAAVATQLWEQALKNASLRTIYLTGEVAAELRAALPAADAEALLRKVMEQAQRESPPHVRLQIALATHLSQTGQPAAALPLLQQALEKTRPNTPEQLTVLLQRGQTQEAAKDVEGTVRTYREVLATYPDNATALNNLAYILVNSPPPIYAPAEARALGERLREVVRGSENAGVMLDTIGWVYYHNNEFDLAAAALEEARIAGGAGLAVELHLGQVYLKQNRTADARAILNEGLDKARQAGEQNRVQEFEDVIRKML
jgi:tetratricopeptide (TPR) repeat protein